MKQYRQWILSLLLGLSSACASNESILRDRGALPLTSDELTSLYSRPRTVAWQGRNRNGTTKLTPDGSISVAWRDGKDQGSWHIANDRLCITYETLRNGREHCLAVYKTGTNEYQTFLESGARTSTFSFTQ